MKNKYGQDVVRVVMVVPSEMAKVLKRTRKEVGFPSIQAYLWHCHLMECKRLGIKTGELVQE